VVRIAGSHPAGSGSIPGTGKYFSPFFSSKSEKITTKMGFEPTRAEPIGLAVQRLNHSATSSIDDVKPQTFPKGNLFSNQKKYFPRRELNPGLLGESQLS
jgi:hypothetical protein